VVDAPRLSARGIELTPLTPNLYEFAYRLAVSPETGFRWRYRGTTPPPETFPQSLWEGVLSQFAVVDDSRRPLGIVAAYGAQPRDQYVYVSAVADPAAIGSGALIIAAGIFIEYLFAVGNFRKIYFDVPEFNLEQFGHKIGKYLHEEGRLVEHEWYGEKYWDLVTLACWRSEWFSAVTPARRYLFGEDLVDDAAAPSERRVDNFSGQHT
jgi:hypothetical protein